MVIDDVEFGLEFEDRFIDEVTKTHYLVEGTEEILIYLKQKYQLHIFSNGFRNITHEKVNGSIINEYVETITTDEDAGVAKPHRDAFQKPIDQTTDATAETAVYIGDDWIAGMAGASRPGMRAILCNP